MGLHICRQNHFFKAGIIIHFRYLGRQCFLWEKNRKQVIKKGKIDRKETII